MKSKKSISYDNVHISDINECADGTHFCGDKQCINLLGSYKCRCSAGFEFNDTVS